MSTVPSWLEVTHLIESYSDSALIAGRVKAWRKEKNWSRRELAERLEALSESSGRREYVLAEPAIVKIENSKRVVSLGEAIGFAHAFGKSLAELVLPDGAFEDADTWRLFEDAVKALTEVRNATQSYEAMVAKLRNQIRELPRVREYITGEHQSARDKADAHHRVGARLMVAEHVLGDIELDFGEWIAELNS